MSNACECCTRTRKATRLMKSVNKPVLREGEIMVHEGTYTVGKVVGTIYPANHKLEGFQQVLQLKDGSRQKFRLVELRDANEMETRDFLEHLVATEEQHASHVQL